jgi:hypothetical protein
MSRFSRITRALPLIISVLVMATQTAWAWHDEGHYYAAVAAVKSMPQDVPAFFREGSASVGHGALDPDIFKNRDLAQLNHCEAPEHFLDLEMLEGRDLPPLRYDYIKMCIELDVDPIRAGTLPYSIAEWTQRLTVAFAEYRNDPDNPHVRAKCLAFAGILSHYSADLHMPLHTSIHWDGRAVDGEPYVRTGIHNKIDALPTKLPYNVLFADPLPTPLASPDVFSFTLDELAKSHAQVQRAYELEPLLPQWDDLSPLTGEIREFTIQRERNAAAFTADLFLSAWRNSANIITPNWLDRKIFDEAFDPDVIPQQPGQ